VGENLESARRFYEVCETAQGWDACKPYCDPDATFSSQANALAEISTIEGYCEWTKNILTPTCDHTNRIAERVGMKVIPFFSKFLDFD
jgi:hypothetical protein